MIDSATKGNLINITGTSGTRVLTGLSQGLGIASTADGTPINIASATGGY